jgi:hypothetical protein
MFLPMLCATLLGLLVGTQTRLCQARVDEVLTDWKKGSASRHSLALEVEAVSQDAHFRDQRETTRYRIKYCRLSDDVFAVLFVKLVPGKGDTKERTEPLFISNGARGWSFDAVGKIVHERRIDPNTGDIGFLWLRMPRDWLLQPYASYLRCDPARLQQEYRVSLVREEKDWRWIRANPTTAEARKDFLVAQVGVLKQAYPGVPKFFPTVVQWKEPSGTVHTWSATSVKLNDQSGVKDSDFDIKPFEESGWTIKRQQLKSEENK